MDDDMHDDEHPTILERAPVPSERTVSAMKTALFVLVALGAIWLVVSVIVLVVRTNSLGETIQGNGAEIDNLQVALQEANERLVEAGETPVAVPDIPTPEPGERGEQGDTGQTGPRGPVGATGPQGPVGDNGRRGPRGFTGPGGPVGSAGPAGPRGADGATGSDGAQGEQGPRGEAGTDGAAGEQGPPGATGPAGTANPGTYLCPDGQVVVGFTISAGGGVTLTCQQTVILP